AACYLASPCHVSDSAITLRGPIRSSRWRHARRQMFGSSLSSHRSRSNRTKTYRCGRIALSFALAAGLLSATVAIASASTADPADGSSTLSMQRAGELAQSSDQPVEVTDETTETSQVMANPDGTYTLTSDLTPVRVKQGDTWRPVDTTLQQN